MAVAVLLVGAFALIAYRRSSVGPGNHRDRAGAAA
jgi:hypothetical protein